MCSISEDDVISERSLETEKKYDAICRKCTAEKAAVILQRKFSYCRSCFLQLVTHKFRSTIGKLKLKQMRDRILVVFTGSQSSIALLHLLQSGMNESNHKKLKFHTDVLVIDDSTLWPEKFNPTSTMSEVLNILKKFPFKRYTVKLSSIYKEPTVRNFDEVMPPGEYDNRLERLFAGMKSSTSKMDLLFHLRSRLSYECAVLLNCNKIFTSECATDVAVQLLSDTTLGRCSHITYDTAICDTRNPLIHRIRPLRELISKEISFYNVFNKLDLLAQPSPAVMFSYNPSLQWDTFLFLSSLQEEFPSTVYTVFNMGDKLKKVDDNGKSTCSLCGMPFSTQTIIESVSNLDEVLLDSSVIVPHDKNDEEQLGHFCYGCQHIIDDADTLEDLPIIVKH